MAKAEAKRREGQRPDGVEADHISFSLEYYTFHIVGCGKNG
jgi:hypothetical protein